MVAVITAATSARIQSRCTLMDAAVLFQVIATSESFGTYGTWKWSQSRVNSLVSSQFFVAGECLAARFFVAFERSLTFNLNEIEKIELFSFILQVIWIINTCVTANVSFKLAVVAERHLTVWTSESFRSLFLAGRRWMLMWWSGIGCRRRVMLMHQRFESGQLIKFTNFIGSHTQCGQSTRM